MSVLSVTCRQHSYSEQLNISLSVFKNKTTVKIYSFIYIFIFIFKMNILNFSLSLVEHFDLLERCFIIKYK